MSSGVWVLPIIILVFVIVIVVSVMHEKKRREGLQLAAERLGLSFDPAGGDVLTREFARFHLFDTGRGRKAQNLMHGGGRDAEVLIFDYQFVTGSGKHRHTHRQTVVAFPLGTRLLPDFEVRPENVFHKIGTAFGYQDIDFAERPGFSSRFLVRGKDEEAVRALFDERRIEALEGTPGICVEGGGAWLVVYRAGKRRNPNDIAAFLEEVRAIRNSFARR